MKDTEIERSPHRRCGAESQTVEQLGGRLNPPNKKPAHGAQAPRNVVAVAFPQRRAGGGGSFGPQWYCGSWQSALVLAADDVERWRKSVRAIKLALPHAAPEMFPGPEPMFSVINPPLPVSGLCEAARAVHHPASAYALARFRDLCPGAILTDGVTIGVLAALMADVIAGVRAETLGLALDLGAANG
jgi:hypothetical protein